MYGTRYLESLGLNQKESTMTENQMLETTLVEDVEVEETEELTLPEIVVQLTDEVFGSDETITPYKVHKIVNSTFKVVGFAKQIPPQMMYNYSRNGMINKVKDAKQYTKDEVIAFVSKFCYKQINK